jgi:hypothetical protein
MLDPLPTSNPNRVAFRGLIKKVFDNRGFADTRRLSIEEDDLARAERRFRKCSADARERRTSADDGWSRS